MPDIKYQDGSTLRTITDLYYQDGSTLRHITAAYYQDGSTLRQVWPSYTPMSGSMANVSGHTHVGTGNAVVGTATASVAGGNSSKTYTFSLTAGDTSDFSLTPSGNTCVIRRPGNPAAGTKSATLRCVVNDGSNTLTLTCTVTDTRT